eukprot:6655232-Prymnesium_polylepis.1
MGADSVLKAPHPHSARERCARPCAGAYARLLELAAKSVAVVATACWVASRVIAESGTGCGNRHWAQVGSKVFVFGKLIVFGELRGESHEIAREPRGEVGLP